MARPLKHVADDAPDMYAFVADAANEQQIDISKIKPIREYPLFWHCRGGKSDKDYIMKLMRWIPASQRHAVSLEYERLYGNGVTRDQRKAANTYLHNEASKYRSMSKC